MKIMIAENIRAFRKERKLTQEQLAEVMGVTVGAVSKWESGASSPDLGTIVELAGFFETSVDVLLGYDWHGGSKERAIEAIQKLRNEKNFEEAAAETEKALQRYPNDFEVTFKGAVMYSMMGIECSSSRAYVRALTLFERSLELIGQNSDPAISEWTIKNYIAQVYLGLDRVDEAIETMKKNNADGLNNGLLGHTLAVEKKLPDEALPYLSEALIDGAARILQVTMGYANAYSQKGDFKSELEILTWELGLISGLRRPGLVSHLDSEEAMVLAACAAAALKCGDGQAAEEYLARARDAAERFDTAPDYGYRNMKFFHCRQVLTAFGDFGSNIMDGIAEFIRKNCDCPELESLWEKVKNR